MLTLKGTFAANATLEKVIDADKRDGLTVRKTKGGPAGDRYQAALFVPKHSGRLPAWLPFLETGFNNVQNLFGESVANSALLVFKVGARFFAIPYGYGRTLLNYDLIVRGFGIRVALGLVDSKKLSTIDSKTIDHNTLYSKLQTQHNAGISDFSFDKESDILSGVCGFPDDKNWLCSKVIGSDALFINPRMRFSEFGKVLKKCRNIYESKDYARDFEWVDNVSLVRAGPVIDNLDEQLVGAIRNRTGEVSLAAPQQIPQENAAGFRFSRGPRQLYEQPQLSSYIAAFRPSAEITLKKMRQDKIHLVDAHNQDAHKWSVYRWLCFEISQDGKHYVLHDGSYYEISDDFRTKVDNAIRKIRRTTISLPTWDQTIDTNEDAYNKCLSNKIKGVLFDKRLATDFEGHSSLEACDVGVFKRNTITLIHVKKYNGSAPLSHLFSQGAVSAHALLEDKRFRDEVRKLLPSAKQTLLPDDIDPAKLEVVYAMAFRNHYRAVVKLMPFFSKLNLKHRAKTLRRLGAEVRIGIIKYVPDPAKAAKRKARRASKP